MEQRVNIKFLVKLKKIAIEAFDLLREETPYEERLCFNGPRGCQKEDDEQPGRPVTIKSDENVENMRTLMRADSRLGIICGGQAYDQSNV
jgi:hypothetical protein